MIPTLEEGDTVLIDRGRKTLVEDGYYAIGVADVLQIKRLQLLPGPKIKIISDNKKYHSPELDPDQVRIHGRLIWSARTWIKRPSIYSL